jgi:hypothetical protein
MKKYAVVVAINILLIVAFMAGAIYAQSGAVNFMGSMPGTTKAANCGTPTSPSICAVGDGIWIWQNATIGWCQPGISCPAPAASSGVTSWNGMTGVVTYTPPAAPVTSVNGKTGAVSIAATTTLQ